MSETPQNNTEQHDNTRETIETYGKVFDDIESVMSSWNITAFQQMTLNDVLDVVKTLDDIENNEKHLYALENIINIGKALVDVMMAGNTLDDIRIHQNSLFYIKMVVNASELIKRHQTS